MEYRPTRALEEIRQFKSRKPESQRMPNEIDSVDR
jgi:hypothetical protein